MLNRSQRIILSNFNIRGIGFLQLSFALLSILLGIAIAGCSAGDPTQPQDVLVPEVKEILDRPNAILFISGPGLVDHRNIFIVNPDGSDMECFTCESSTILPESPTWSPDGSAFAFTAATQTTDLVKDGINVSWVGGVNHALIFSNDDFADPTWSPDGSQIAFSYSKYLGEDSPSGSQFADPQICMLPVPSSGGQDAVKQIQCITKEGWNEQPHWSPDGKKIVYVGSSDRDSASDLFTINIDGSSKVALTQTQKLSELSPSWSPDGEKIAYYIYDPPTRERNLWVMNSDGSNSVSLTSSPNDGWDPAWSPDGNKIAFVTSRTSSTDQSWCEMGCLDYSELYVMNADGTNPRNISNNPEVTSEKPDWRPNTTSENSWVWWLVGGGAVLLTGVISTLLVRRRRKI